MKAQLLIAAAGMGRRLGLQGPKALARLGGKSLVAATLERLLPLNLTPPTLVLFPKGYGAAFREHLETLPAQTLLVEGGEERQDSVRRGLDALNNDTEIVVIHDAARPFAPIEAIAEAMEAAHRVGAATLASPAVDTILMDDGGGMLASTPDRSRLWACQTPQVFQTAIIRQAYALAQLQGLRCTDDATLAKAAGTPVALVDGGPMNFKITTRLDLDFANYLWDKGIF